jgi:hypothetical protein
MPYAPGMDEKRTCRLIVTCPGRPGGPVLADVTPDVRQLASANPAPVDGTQPELTPMASGPALGGRH